MNAKIECLLERVAHSGRPSIRKGSSDDTWLWVNPACSGMQTPVLLAMVACLVNQLRYSIIEIVEFQRKEKDSSTNAQVCCACLWLFTVRICGILLVILEVFFICGILQTGTFGKVFFSLKSDIKIGIH